MWKCKAPIKMKLVMWLAIKNRLQTKDQVMALELGPHGIGVNSISPGVFKSEITKKLVEKEWLGKVTRRTMPLVTLGITNPTVTSVIRYLIHDASEYVSGNVFIVDAGATLSGVPIFSSL
ncbi:3-oxoacyl-[acyl-carrier protein] reductase [Canna indica]|uniref:3-oxoacyl-[acyl-carrier protein] reductase n=1 Tax=Canna indica TaxID=4628 RepID=A0AAQ3Q422_9LILI|nr:3-oxoacyl-[acyl-carrier protein] reductase [Canna indica]